MTFDLLARLRDQPVIGIVRAADRASSAAQLGRLRAAGIALAEVTLTTPGALDLIAGDLTPPGGAVGAGTVVDVPSARDAIDAGAQFLLAPNASRDIVEFAVSRGVPMIPGCATPTEMMAAMSWGATAVKLFPAVAWGPAALRALLGALPALPVLPTGGIGRDEASTWIASGAVGVGMGSAVADADPAILRDWLADLGPLPRNEGDTP